jgi:CDGSH-type Zn-finger protein
MSTATAARIEVTANGPYRVDALAQLVNSKGEAIATGETVWLCRCGGSRNKPFCDGTHNRNGFTGERETDGARDRRISYRGAAITVHDNRGLCAHVGECTDGLRAVFDSKRERWIDPDAAEATAIADVVRRCPSAALAYSLGDAEWRDPDAEPTVVVSENGPYYVSGAVDVVGAQFGDGAARRRFALCRCGGSKNKPFCDGTHWANGFLDPSN